MSIRLRGWIEVPNRRISSQLRFFLLRQPLDGSSVIPYRTLQLLSKHSPKTDIGKKLDSLTSESCVAVDVVKTARPVANQREGQMYDYHIEDIELLNSATSTLPFLPASAHAANSLVRAQNRHVEMRSESLGTALRERYRINKNLRTRLDVLGFIEVETPILFKSTPEGAREFLVPTRKEGHFFALPQSPQQYKQILMAGGVHRYFQFARCFRDEDSRADRQLEFTQLDLELSFATQDQVMAQIEKIVAGVEQFDGVSKCIDKDGRVPKMTYTQAMTQYGSDKPDLRFDLRIRNISDLLNVTDHTIEILHYPKVFASNKHLKILRERLGQGVFAFSINSESEWLQPRKNLVFDESIDVQKVSDNLEIHCGDIVLIAQRPKQLFGGSTAIGSARLELQSWLEKLSLVKARDPHDYKLTWITDFPLFSPTSEGEPGQGGTKGLSSTHHPFTAPHPEDVHLLYTDPEKVRGQHYDLVMNGVELGGGSIRIHHAEMQRRIFEEVLGMDEQRIRQFSHLLDVLESGCPPHGGFALGFDRFVATLLGKTSIREVIAFPKTSGGQDALIGSPTTVPKQTLSDYHLSVDCTL